MITSLRQLSLRHKLTGSILAVSALVLMLSAGILLTNEWLSLKQNLSDDLHTLANVVGINGGVGLAFDNREAMEQTLTSLRAKDNILFAHAFDRQGRHFAGYARPDSEATAITGNLIDHYPGDLVGIGPIERSQSFFFDRHLEVFAPIRVDGTLLGTLYIRSDLREFEQRRNRYLLVVAITVLLALGLAYLPAVWLQGIVTRPVLHLLGTIHRVREQQDYSLRAVKSSDDELGRLQDGFNAMLAKIEADNKELESYRHHLETMVEERTHEKELAERANEAKTRFFAAASHDLRQPLHALSWFLDLLREKVRQEEAQEIVLKAQHSVEAMQGLFGALLDISRLEAGVVKADISAFALDKLCHGLHDEFDAQAKEKGLAFTVTIEPLQVRSDPVLLERILRNLLGNAFKYTQAGEVLLTAKADGETVRLEVRDSGVGIEPQHQTEVFDEFLQLDNPERDRSKGLGLGLSIVRRLVELLGHPLRLHSTPGVGTTFTLSLPAGGEPIEPHLPAPRQTPFGGKSATIILIDDEALIREGMGKLLDEWGHRTLVAESEAEALALLEREGVTPDIVIADYRLRGNKTGVEAIGALRKRYGEGLPAIIITGDTLPEHLESVRAGGDQVLLKPVKPAHLRKLIGYHLRRGE